MTGSEFKAIREALGLSQREVAELLGYSGKTAISNLEAKEKHPDLLACVLMRMFKVLSAKRSMELREQLLEFGAKEKLSRKRTTR